MFDFSQMNVGKRTAVFLFSPYHMFVNIDIKTS